ncbi:hypothetical protein BC826DRAFT_107359 [Russula brevipes]|nr:hypothetical protein BC826DRAFT_107359 [Russula brevipes]
MSSRTSYLGHAVSFSQGADFVQRVIISRKMHLAFRIASRSTRCYAPLLQISPVVPHTISLSHDRQIRTRFSSTESSKKVTKVTNAPKNQLSSVRSLPALPPPPKGTPPTITSRDIKKYVQPLYSRGWGLSPILPDEKGIAVLSKRFEFMSAQALQAFLADLSEYERKAQHHARTNVFEDEDQHTVLVSTWTHVARSPNADAEDEDPRCRA